MSEPQPKLQTDEPKLTVKLEVAFDYPYAPQPDAESTWSPPPRFDGDAVAPWLPLGLLAVGAALINVAAQPLVRAFDVSEIGEIIAYVFVATLFAQIATASAWLAWGPQWFGMRLALHWAYVAGNCCALIIGDAICGNLQDSTEWMLAIRGLLMLPAVALAIQAPLWLARQYLGWRIELPSASGNGTRSPATPFTIRDLMLGTVVVAVSMALARAASAIEPDEEYWLVFAIAMPILMMVSAVAILPVAVFLLQRQDWRTGLVMVALEVLTIAGTIAAIGFALKGFDFDDWNHFGITVTLFGCATAISTAALTARLAGYRLVIGRR